MSDVCTYQGRELSRFSTLNKRRNVMVEKDSQKPKVAFTSASDSDPEKEEPNLSSDNTMPSAHDLKSTDAGPNRSEFCGNDTIFSDKTNIVDKNSFNYQLGEINQTGNALDFLGNSENKDSNDFLYYGWPEIGNFDDIDGMFRSCNSTFDLGFSKDAESGWLSSTDDLGKSEEVDIKFPCPELDVVKKVSENHEFPKDSINNDSWTSENSNSCISFASEHGTADRKDGFVPQEQGLGFSDQQRVLTNKHSRTGDAAVINKHRKQIKLQSHSEGKSKEHYSGNRSCNRISDLSNEVMPLASGLTSQHVLPSFHMRQNQLAQCPDSYNYLQNHISFVKPSSDKSETTALTSISTKDSSYNASGQLQYMEICGDPPFEITAQPVCEQRETLHSCEGKYEKYQDSGGDSLATRAELGSSNVQESSLSNSGFSDLSQEAASFRQLQLVTEQLDSRMKLCIRDSLYRLARSAEQRHNHANLNVGSGSETDAVSGTTMNEGTNKCASFMDMETDTNPVDRSIAHLLFYQPSNSPSVPFHYSFPFKSPSVVYGSAASPPVMAEKLVSEEFEAAKVEIADCVC
ncbi:hypothetical protein CASFOL_019860 [Castilleja foliolosa]|uniref:Protein LNK1 n=1 Tax=Castilleja foliolosa TaxID=1961234 RepID=A0ABD3D011_9LAMI